MNCPTCGCGTLKKVAVLETDPSEFVWCPACGTLATGPGVGLPPELIGKCREFQMQMRAGTGLGSQYASRPLSELWNRLGIPDRISKPKGATS